MYGQGPTWGSAVVIGLAGFSTGLLVAALLVAGRTPPRTTDFSGSQTPTSSQAQPATVTVTGAEPAPRTVTREILSPPETTTSVVEVTVPPSSTTTSTPTTTTSPSRTTIIGDPGMGF